VCAYHNLATTRWSLVLRAGDRSSPDAAAALAALCEIYWYPVYAFVRRKGYDAERARDLTQAFFTRLLEREFIASADPQRGRFRAFLLTALQHFLSNENERDHAQKRGGGLRFVPLDFDHGEARYCAEPSTTELTPEALYERRWALMLLNEALDDLQAEAEASGKSDQFAAIRPLLARSEIPYQEVAAHIGMSCDTLRVTVHRLRRRFARAIRRRIAATVSSADDVDREIAYLMEIVGRG
jgi:RNA polymerase sigma factor (sigma-70 family)